MFAMYFTSAGYVDQRRDPACVSGEATPDIALLAVRLRYGSDEWEMPDLLLDYPDINDVAPLLWHDRGVVRLFWGGYLSGVPFQTAVSRDNGATWTDLRFIRPTGSFGPFGVGQPINTAFRGSDERIYVACDGADKDSVLWASSDNGRTWQDTGGRTGGRHSTCVKLRARIAPLPGREKHQHRRLYAAIALPGRREELGCDPESVPRAGRQPAPDPDSPRKRPIVFCRG